MKKNTKKFVIGTLTGCMTLACAAAFAACDNPDSLPPFDYDYSSGEEMSDGIVLDGKLDETLWEGKRVLDAEIRNTDCTFEMTSLYGEKGVYFGFRVKDNAVYFNEGTDAEINSGVQFCVGPADNKSIGYRIALNAGGKKQMKKWIRPASGGDDGFILWSTNLRSAVWVDGEVNGECEGYSAELYLPYSLFHEPGAANADEKPEKLLVNPAICRAESAYVTTDWSRRLWYSIGIEERGIGWNEPQDNWYGFNENGLIAHDVTISSGEHGKIEGKDWYIAGDSYTLTVKPDEGYCVSSLKVNGKEFKDKIFYRNGFAMCNASADGALTVTAEFEALPAQTYVLSGTAGVTGDDSPEINLYAARSGAYVPVTLENGAYSVNLPGGEWLIVGEATGYLTRSETVNLEADTVKDIVLGKSFMQPDNAANWDFTELGSGKVSGLSGGWMVSAKHTEINAAEVFVSGRIVVPMTAGADTRVGFSLSKGSNNIFVSLMAHGENGADSYDVQIIVNGQWGNGDIGNLESVVGKEIRALASEGGVPFAVGWKDGKLSVWVNGTCVRDAIALDSKYGFTNGTEVVPGLMTCGKGSYSNLEFALEGTGAMNGTLRDKDGNALSGVTVTLTPESGEALTRQTNEQGGYDFGKLPVGGYTFAVEETGYNKYEAEFLLTSAGIMKEITLADFTEGADMIVSGGDYYDYSRISDGKIVFKYDSGVNGEVSYELVFKEKAGAEEDFFVTAVIKKQDSFVMDDNGGLSYGFQFSYGGTVLVARFSYDKAHNNWLLQFTNWNNIWSGYDFGATAPAAWTDGSGMRIGVARVNGVFGFYLEDENGIMKRMCTETRSPLNNAEVTMSIVCWTQVMGAEFNEFEWITGEIPLDVQKNAPEHGTATVTNAKLGKDVTITLTPENGYVVGSLTVNGENITSRLQKDGTDYSVTLSAFAVKTLKIETQFIEEQQVTVTLLLPDLEDDTLVTLKGAGVNRTANVSEGKAIFEEIEKGSYTLIVEGYRDAEIEITEAGEKPVTLEEISMQEIMSEKYVAEAGECYDVSKIESEKKIVYTGTSGEAHMKFKLAPAEGEDFWLESTFKVQDTFLQGEAGGYRYGFTIFGGTAVHFTIVDNNGFAINNWSDVGESCGMSAGQRALLNGAGLRVAVARIGGRVYWMADDGNGSMKVMLSTAGGGIGNQTLNLGLATWYQAKGLEYNEFAYRIGTIPVTVNKNTPEHGTVEVSENPVMGGRVTVTLTPDEGYTLSTITINGAAAAATQSGNSFVVTIAQYLSNPTMTVSATFAEMTEFDITLTFTGVPDDTEITLKGVRTYTATVVNNVAEIKSVQKGDYTVEAENYHSDEITVSGEGDIAVNLVAFTVEEKYVEADGDCYDVSKIESEQKIVYTGTSGEAHMKLKLAAAEGEDFWLESTLKVQDTFLQGEDGGFRYGYTLFGVGTNVHVTIVNHDTFALNNWGDVNESCAMSDGQKALLNGTGLRFAIARIDGWLYIYADDGNGAMVKMLASNTPGARKTVNLGFATWYQARELEYNNVSWQIGSIPEGIPAPELTVFECVANDGSGAYSYWDLLTKSEVTFTGGKDAYFELRERAAGNEDVYLEAVIRKDAEFDMTNFRYGFLLGSLNVNLTNNGWQMISWKGGAANADMTEAQRAKWESEEGIRIGAARINKVFYMFAEDENGEMQQIMSLNGTDVMNWDGSANIAEAELTVGLGAWNQVSGTTFKEFTWKIGTDLGITVAEE